MGRVSKRITALRSAVSQKDTGKGGGKRYKAGIYARLSANHDVKKNESVEAQIEIAKKYVEEFNQKQADETIDIVQCYTDLGKTGSSFEREGFLRLLQDIRIGEINCVIVKDLSRFGRNYLETGNYIEKIFPFLGVRFIAVADGFDTGVEGNENKQMASEIKNLVNDMYAKDFSKKAKLHLQKRREEGSYVGGPPPYGYIAAWNGKRRVLIPDENTAAIVRFIYERFIETEGYTAVANELNRRKLNPPAIYKKTKEVYHSSDAREYKGWDKGVVESILKNKAYIGMLTQGKTSITARAECNRIHKPEEEWVITKNTHEPLIQDDLYKKVEYIREKIRNRYASHNHPSQGCPLEENVFDSVLYCGVCGRKMTRDSQVKQYADGEKIRREGYFCLNAGQTKVTICPESNRILKTELADMLLPLIRMEFAVFLDKPKKYMEYGNKCIAEAVKNAEASLRETERKIVRVCEQESSLYMGYRAGNISQKEYAACKMKQEAMLADLRKRKEGQEREKKELGKVADRYLSVLKALLRLKSGTELTKEMVEAFISAIYVYPGKRMEVLFAFTVDGMEGVKGWDI